jgi:probable enterotoxin B
MSTSSGHLATIYAGDEVQIVENPKSGWYYGSFNGVTGYIRTKYIKYQTIMSYPEPDGSQPNSPPSQDAIFGPDNPQPSDPVQPSNPASPDQNTAAIKSGLIANFRDRPSVSGNIIGELMPGTPVVILGKEGSWYYIEANGMKGYVSEVCISDQ